VLLDANMPELDGFGVAERIAARPELTGTTIMMLTASGQHVDASRCQAPAIHASLTKPVPADHLFAAICRAMGPVPRPPEPATHQPIAVTGTPLRVLVAEDNVVNQRVAVGLLAARGHVATVVADGREAVDTWQRQPFDAILMDVQMPGMSGMEAARAIRLLERHTGAHVRIVAMTAYAMDGDRERFLEAGMDGYVSKPVDPATLFREIEQTGPGPMSWETAPPAAAPPDAPPIDRDAMLHRLGGDESLFADVARLFREDAPARLEALDEALAARDAVLLREAAHALKGAAGNLSAHGLLEAARELEALALSGSLDGAAGHVARVAREARRVVDYFGLEAAGHGDAR